MINYYHRDVDFAKGMHALLYAVAVDRGLSVCRWPMHSKQHFFICLNTLCSLNRWPVHTWKVIPLYQAASLNQDYDCDYDTKYL